MSMVYSFLTVFFVNISWQLKAYGYGGMTAAWIFIFTNIAGILNLIMIKSMIKKFGHKTSLTLFGCGGTLSILVMFLALELNAEWMIFVGSALSGACLYPFLTTLTDFASNTAFPLSEAISAGFFLFGGQLFGVVLAVVGSLFFFNGKDILLTRAGIGMQVLLMLGGTLVLFFSK